MLGAVKQGGGVVATDLLLRTPPSYPAHSLGLSFLYETTRPLFVCRDHSLDAYLLLQRGADPRSGWSGLNKCVLDSKAVASLRLCAFVNLCLKLV